MPAPRPPRFARSPRPAFAGGMKKGGSHAEKISRPDDLHTVEANAIPPETSLARDHAQHQGVPLLARLRRRALPPRALVPGSRMLLAAAAKTADRGGVAGAQAGRVLDLAVVGGQHQGLRRQKALLSRR